MNEERHDREWLREYLQGGAESAFRELVLRHGRMVKATVMSLHAVYRRGISTANHRASSFAFWF